MPFFDNNNDTLQSIGNRQLDYLEEDGQTVEPRYFIPVIPALLLNGSHGIGTGWSTYIPPYRTKEIAEHVAMKIR
jgi:DNA topoisomerase-2